jgi:hypothetical protein
MKDDPSYVDLKRQAARGRKSKTVSQDVEPIPREVLQESVTRLTAREARKSDLQNSGSEHGRVQRKKQAASSFLTSGEVSGLYQFPNEEEAIIAEVSAQGTESILANGLHVVYVLAESGRARESGSKKRAAESRGEKQWIAHTIEGWERTSDPRRRLFVKVAVGELRKQYSSEHDGNSMRLEERTIMDQLNRLSFGRTKPKK